MRHTIVFISIMDKLYFMKTLLNNIIKVPIILLVKLIFYTFNEVKYV